MPASWKKIVLEGLDADLNQITASNGIQITSSLTLTAATDTDFKVLVADPTTGDVKGEDQENVGAQGSNLSSFTTMSIGGTATVSASSTNNTLNIITSSGNPLTIVGASAIDVVEFTVVTQSREEVEDYASVVLAAGTPGAEVGNHKDIFINYSDGGQNDVGTFSLTGSSPILFGDTPGDQQNEVVFTTTVELGVSESSAKAGHFVGGTDNVKFHNITASKGPVLGFGFSGAPYSDFTNPNSGEPGIPAGGVFGTGYNPMFFGGDGNISQRTNLQVNGFYGGANSPYTSGGNMYGNPLGGSSGDWISASALHIVNDSHISGNLTIPDNQSFIFQGYGFTDSQVLSHADSNIFGSGDMPAALTASQQFTGSIIVTGSSITLQQSGSFNGNGSEITGITASAIEGVNGDDLLYITSFGSSIGSAISGAYSADGTTIQLLSGEFSAITASGDTVTSTTGLASGKQIYTFLSASDADFLNTIAANYVVSASANDTSGLDITTTGNIGTADGVVTQTIELNISKSTDGSSVLEGGDSIMFMNNSVAGDPTVKETITTISGSIVGSVLGTVTGISAGDGIDIVNPTGYGTAPNFPVLNTTINILLSGSDNVVASNSNTISVNEVGGHTISNLVIEANNDLGLNPLLNITSIDAGTGSFTHLKVTDENSLTNLETDVVSISDNFMWLNNGIGDIDPLIPNPHDAGISLNRGNSNDANLFWDENVRRWSLSKEDLQTNESTGSLPNSYLILTTKSTNAPTNPESGFETPLYGVDDNGDALSDSSTVGQIHVHTDATSPEVWIYA